MRLIKPFKIGLIHRSYTQNDLHHFAVTPLLFFSLSAPDELISESEGWARAMRSLPERQPLDEGIPKGVSEVLHAGSAYGMGQSEIETRISIGGIDKRLRVVGNRHWQKSWFGYRASAPGAFDTLPMTWDRAFGHPDDPENTEGVGPLVRGEN